MALIEQIQIYDLGGPLSDIIVRLSKIKEKYPKARIVIETVPYYDGRAIITETTTEIWIHDE